MHHVKVLNKVWKLRRGERKEEMIKNVWHAD